MMSAVVPAGKPMIIRTGRAARHEWLLRAITSKLTPHEQAQLKAALGLLNRIVDTE